jgi:hypothetical protein
MSSNNKIEEQKNAQNKGVKSLIDENSFSILGINVLSYVDKLVGSKIVTFYQVEITSRITKNSWKIDKRYSEFKKLHDAMLKIYPRLPKIPGTTLFKVTSPEALKSRQKALEAFLRSCVQRRDILQNKLFKEFLELEKNAPEIVGNDVDLYYDENFAHGRVVFNENIIAEDDIRAFIDAPSPIVVYDKLTKEEAPNLLYLEYYRGGAYEDELITIDEENPNYLNCNLDGVVLNPNGAIKYYNHYHSALYEDEEFDYFIPYQVRVVDKYTGIHSGPARKYKTLAMIIDEDTYTIVEERNGWGRLKEYFPTGWILLNATEPITGPGQNPDYDPVDAEVATIPFASRVHITKLTIDRLWCYVPELESWVKAEDISYD